MTHPYTRLFTSASAPTVNDDVSLGYEVGDIWLTSTTSYQCLDATDGAAIWLDIGRSSENIQDVVGAMFTGGVQVGVTASYDDPSGTIDLVTDVVPDGWIVSPGTWTYSSADAPIFVITVNTDLTGKIGVGDRIKLMSW